MSGHGRALARAAMLSAGVAVLVAGHGIILYNVLSHTALSTTVVLGIATLVVIEHVGLFSPLYVWFRRHFPRRR